LKKTYKIIGAWFGYVRKFRKEKKKIYFDVQIENKKVESRFK
jgi:hypothetical protein